VHCPACGFSNIDAAKYCAHCGKQIGPNPEPPQTLERKSGFGLGAKLGIVLLGLILLSIVSRSCSNSTTTGNVTGTPATSTIAEATSSTTEPNGWDESVSTSPMDSKTTVVLSRTSADSYQAWLTNPTPRVVVQCYTRHRPDVFVDIKGSATVEYGDELHTVRIKLDDGSPNKQRWSQSKDDQALFASNPVALISDMKRHKKMLFEFDPFNTPSSATVSFDLAGLSESMAKHPECASK